MNAAQISQHLKNSPSVRTIQTMLARMEDLGRIERTGKARALVWKLAKK